MSVAIRRQLTAEESIHNQGANPTVSVSGPIRPSTVALVLSAVAAMLAVISAVSQVYLLQAGDAAPFAQTLSRFDIDGEATLPAWYATVLLLACAGMLALIASHVRRHGGSFKLRWALLALVFVGLSIDEACAFHEIALDRVDDRFDTGGIFYFLWVWAALPVVLVLGLFFLPLVLSLPKRIAVMFTVAGLLFLGGALGAEAVSGWIIDRYGIDEIAYIVTATIEESMEFAGVILFLYALLLYRGILIKNATVPAA